MYRVSLLFPLSLSSPFPPPLSPPLPPSLPSFLSLSPFPPLSPSSSLPFSPSLSLSLHTCASLQWGVFVACTEWTVFVCTHTLGHTWKHAFGAAPWWVKMVMDNGNINQLFGELIIL